MAANHPSSLDSFYLETLSHEPFYILAHTMLFTVPLLGMYMQLGNHIPVDPANGADAFRQARQKLEFGHTVLIFPEGGISPQPNKPHPFRSGAVRLAMLTGAPIIPIGLYVPRQKPLWRCKNCYLWGKYGVTVGQPRYFNGETRNKAQVTMYTTQLQQAIEELICQSRQRSSILPAK